MKYKLLLVPSFAYDEAKHTEDGETVFNDVDLYDINSSLIDDSFFSDASTAFHLLASCAGIYYSEHEEERLNKLADYLLSVDTYIGLI